MDEKKKRFPSLSRNQIIIFAAISLVLFVIFVTNLGAFWGGVKQPIAFNHGKHAENGLECPECHPFYEEHASSGRPSIEVCSGCHEEAQGENPEEKKIVEHVGTGKEVEWKRLYRVPEDVYFSHRRHVILGELECSTCHGSIGESQKPPSKPVKITMKKCMKCHEERDVENDCIACHR